MKYIFLLFTIFLSNPAFCSIDTLQLDGHKLVYYSIKQGPQRNKLVIFMHGAVSQYQNRAAPGSVPVEELLENNDTFLESMKASGFDVILPIAYNEYNWLDKKGADYIFQLVQEEGAEYGNVYLSGFSDGGTGAYRLFYERPGLFSGVIIFNGYPQLKNQNKQVNYLNVTNKNVIFCSSTGDKVIPYEFPMVEFRKQQIVNKHTWFILGKGGHAFSDYGRDTFEKCVALLAKTSDEIELPEGSITVYPPVDGFIQNGMLEEVYPFRKKTGKQFGMKELDYSRNDYDLKTFRDLLENGSKITLQPAVVPEDSITSQKTFVFSFIINGNKQSFELINWLAHTTW